MRKAGSRSPSVRAFLDANVLFSLAWRPDGGLRRLREVPDIELITSRYALLEARRNLPDGALPALDEWLRGVDLVPDVMEGALPTGVVLPEKDRPILLSALAANASHLITGDRAHFGAYFRRRFEGLWIGPPAAFLAERGEADPGR